MWSNTLSSLQYCKYRYFADIATNKNCEKRKTKTLGYNFWNIYLRCKNLCNSFNRSSYWLSPFYLSYVTVSRPCCLSEFYPNRASSESPTCVNDVSSVIAPLHKMENRKGTDIKYHHLCGYSQIPMAHYATVLKGFHCSWKRINLLFSPLFNHISPCNFLFKMFFLWFGLVWFQSSFLINNELLF